MRSTPVSQSDPRRSSASDITSSQKPKCKAYPCPGCSKNVHTKAVQCDFCNKWYHASCLSPGITDDQVKVLSLPIVLIKCSKCATDPPALPVPPLITIPTTDSESQVESSVSVTMVHDVGTSTDGHFPDTQPPSASAPAYTNNKSFGLVVLKGGKATASRST